MGKGRQQLPCQTRPQMRLPSLGLLLSFLSSLPSLSKAESAIGHAVSHSTVHHNVHSTAHSTVHSTVLTSDPTSLSFYSDSRNRSLPVLAYSSFLDFPQTELSEASHSNKTSPATHDRILLSLAATATACTGASCPGGSTCIINFRGPLCMCPKTKPHWVNNRCSTKALQHSDYLDLHNSARFAFGLAPLVWSDILAGSALQWAKKLTNCDLFHPQNSPFGQNLASVWGISNEPPSFGINLWLQEAQNYRYSIFPAGCRAGKDCGHYTQMLWSSTSQVGCAQAPCSKGGAKGTVWACDYNPPGNFIGQFPYKKNPCQGVLCPSTSKCVGTTGFAICTCPNGQTLVNGVCRADPCKRRKTKCPGNLVCTAPAGVPLCGCLLGLVPDKTRPNICIPPVCQGVRCPSRGSCRSSNSVPVCLCPAGYNMIKNGCTRLRGQVSSTSLAVYNAPAFSGAPAVIRVSKACVNLPVGYKGHVGSFSVAWAVTSARRGTTQCNGVYFWSNTNCVGTGQGPLFSGQPVTFYASLGGAPQAAAALSVSCA